MGAPEIRLAAADYVLDLGPTDGGAIERFEWCGAPLMRARCGLGPLNSACFPLTPFSNRIAEGRFVANGREVRLAPNFPGAFHPHPLHGFGWLKPWRVARADEASAALEYVHEANEWPWRFLSTQSFALSQSGLHHAIGLTNLSDKPMPAGLGLHPYFPRTPQTRYTGRHRGEWTTSPDGLPVALTRKDRAVDWWEGAPVAARVVDTVYTGREGALEIAWPERDLRVTMLPSPLFSFTTVYAPKGADFFCVEPVSHVTNAVNRQGDEETGLRWLGPGESLSGDVVYVAAHLEAGS